jgi:histidinol-phosphate aminotransferase
MTTATPSPTTESSLTKDGSGILPKRSVQKVVAYVPPLEGRRTKIRLDFNENTLGYPQVSDPLDLTLINTYPEYTAFINDLAQQYGLQANQILLTNGSDEALSVLANTFIEPGEDCAVLATPTFALIPHYLTLADARIVTVPITQDLQLDTAGMEAAIAANKPKIVIVASPDNPTGGLMPLEALRGWVETFPNTLFVVDEAYAEYCGQSVLEYLKQRLAAGHENLMMTRTFSKAWALAGLRLGFVVGSPRLVEVMTRVRSPYSVNTLAANFAHQLLPSKALVEANAQDTMARKAALMDALRERGYGVHAGHGNFFLLKVGVDAAALTDFCSRHGILLRDRSMVPALAGMVRISVGSTGENEAFLAAVDAFKQQHVLLLDVDGTLVDTSNSFDAVVATLVERYTQQPLKEGELAALRARGGFNDDWDSIEELCKRRGVTITQEKISEEGLALYLSIAKDNETLMLNETTLAGMAKRYRLGLVTGRYRSEYDAIWAERLNPFVEVVVCRDDVANTPGKPAPDLLIQALKAMNATEGLYVGNSIDDVKAAIAAGLTAIAVETTQSVESLMQGGATLVLPTPQHFSAAFCP